MSATLTVRVWISTAWRSFLRAARIAMIQMTNLCVMVLVERGPAIDNVKRITGRIKIFMSTGTGVRKKTGNSNENQRYKYGRDEERNPFPVQSRVRFQARGEGGGRAIHRARHVRRRGTV